MKALVVALAAAALIIGSGFFLSALRGGQPAASADNVAVVDGRQYVDLTAKGGYSPLRSQARAGIPTTLRVGTKGTFDCSSAIRIPLLGVSTVLPATGVTEIDLGSPQAGTLQGTCGMGMYRFEIAFSG